MSRYAALRRHDLQRRAASEAHEAELPTLPLYGCTGCGACTTACLHKVEPATALMRGRAEAESAERGHPALHDLPARQHKRAQAAARSLAGDEALRQRAAGEGDVAFLPSCLPRGSQAGASAGPAAEARSMLRVCDGARAKDSRVPELGVALLPLGCAGYPLYAGGYSESFRLHAESFARSVEKYSTLVVSCSACAWLLRAEYRAHGVPLRPQVQHVSEFLAPHAASLPVAKTLPQAVYHDPCHLGRRLGCLEPPRQLLRRAVDEVKELPGSHGKLEGRCCGSGGLLPLTSPELAKTMANERLADAEPQDGPIVTSCPACQHHLKKSSPNRDVRYLLDVLDECTK
jgi:Fe-S oxidoreductase